MNRHRQSKRPPVQARRVAEGALPAWVTAAVYAFGCGMGAALLLLSLFAFLMERFSLSVALVRPLALGAAWCGAALSGLVLASRLGRQRLLCGLACGAFYCLCLALASFLTGGMPDPQALDLSLPVALLLGGAAGGIFSALRAGGAQLH